MSLRVCLSGYKGFMRIEDNRAVGSVGSIFQLTLHHMSRFANVTLEQIEDRGQVVDENRRLYDGCVGKIQNNESDTHYPELHYPILGPGLKYLPNQQMSQLAIGSFYNISHSHSYTDVMEAVKSLTPLVWFTIFAAAAILSLLPILDEWFSGRFLKRISNRVSPFTHRMPVESPSGLIHDRKRFLELLFAVHAFLATFYFASMIQTEMVVQTKPKTVDSYADIVNRKIRPTWGRGIEHLNFARAPKDSDMGRVWSLAQEIGLDKCLLDAKNLGEITGQLLKKAVKQEMVFMASKSGMMILGSAVCSFMTNFDGEYKLTRAWMRVDDSSPEKVSAFVVSDKTDPKIVKSLFKLYRRRAEHRFWIADQMYMKATKNAEQTQVRECMANVMQYPAPQVTVPNLFHYRSLFIIVSCLLLVALVLLFSERY